MDEIHEMQVPPAKIDWSVLGEAIPDGVYFGFDEEAYHAAPALSASGIKNLLVSPMDFWARASWLNPDYESEDSYAKSLGKAYDKRITEGKEAFYSVYAEALDPKAYPNALRTADEIKERLKLAELKTSGKKDDLVARLLEHDPSAEIWDTLISEHAEANAGKELLPRDQIHRIELAAAMIEKHPQLCKSFTGGYPQVSIFWHDENGVPMKARLDYLKTRAIVDLKTFSNAQGKPIDRAVAYNIASYKYHVQVAVYLEAVEAAKSLPINGEPEPIWLNKWREADDPEFLFVFQQTGVAPVARGYVFPKALALDCARIEVRGAKETFALCVDTFGTDPWIDTVNIRTFEDLEFPAFMTAG